MTVHIKKNGVGHPMFDIVDFCVDRYVWFTEALYAYKNVVLYKTAAFEATFTRDARNANLAVWQEIPIQFFNAEFQRVGFSL